jgi:hypothetical protein
MMETAKVDIRKLQALNDRINQCIDALNQVRLSVHGLQHTSPGVPFLQAGANPLAQAGAFGVGYPAFGQVPLAQPIVQGLSHTSPALGASPGFIPGVGQMYAGVGQVFNPLLGLSHTSGEEYIRPAWADPFIATRIVQTFPYAQYAVPPVVTIY